MKGKIVKRQGPSLDVLFYGIQIHFLTERFMSSPLSRQENTQTNIYLDSLINNQTEPFLTHCHTKMDCTYPVAHPEAGEHSLNDLSWHTTQSTKPSIFFILKEICY